MGWRRGTGASAGRRRLAPTRMGAQGICESAFRAPRIHSAGGCSIVIPQRSMPRGGSVRSSTHPSEPVRLGVPPCGGHRPAIKRNVKGHTMGNSNGGGGKGGGGGGKSGGGGGGGGGGGSKGGSPPNAPSTTGNPSGGGRGNNPPSK